jgi:hypothetical protein
VKLLGDKKGLPLWGYLAVLGFLTFYTYDIAIVSDMGWYMNAALNIYRGKGYTDINNSLILTRGPLFPIMVVGSYWLLKVSPWSAFWVVRIFAILTPLSIYALGKKLFDKWVGISAALLILTSYSINHWSYRHLDAVWPFFAILSLLTLYAGLEEGKSRYLILSGFFFALGYLVKAAIIVLLPLPFVLVLIINDYKTKDNLLGLLFFALTITILISPWICYVYSHTLNFKSAIFGIGGDEAFAKTIDPKVSSIIGNYITGLVSYYSRNSQSISNNFTLAPLFVCAWIYIIYNAIKKDKASILVSVTLILLSPYMSYVGRQNLRVGQILLFFLITYLVIVKLCLDIIKILLLDKLKEYGLNENAITLANVFFILSLILVQTVVSKDNDRGNKDFLRRSYLYQKVIKSRDSSRVLGNFGEASIKCGEWVRDSLSKGSRFIISDADGGGAVFFYAGGSYPMFYMPIINSKVLSNFSVDNKDSEAIFISSWIGKVDPRNKIFGMRESDLYQTIAEKKINYLILDRRRNFLTLYFASHPKFKFVKEFGNGAIKIFEVLSSKKTVAAKDFKILVTHRLIEYLNGLRVANDERLDWYKTLLSDKQRVGMSDKIVLVRAGRVYQIK